MSPNSGLSEEARIAVLGARMDNISDVVRDIKCDVKDLKDSFINVDKKLDGMKKYAAGAGAVAALAATGILAFFTKVVAPLATMAMR